MPTPQPAPPKGAVAVAPPKRPASPGSGGRGRGALESACRLTRRQGAEPLEERKRGLFARRRVVPGKLSGGEGPFLGAWHHPAARRERRRTTTSRTSSLPATRASKLQQKTIPWTLSSTPLCGALPVSGG